MQQDNGLGKRVMNLVITNLPTVNLNLSDRQCQLGKFKRLVLGKFLLKITVI